MHIVFTKNYIKHIKIMALRNGKWFKLTKDERVIINLVIKILNYVKNKVLINILIKIFEKISPQATYIYKAYLIGLKMLEKRIEQAKQIGYKKIKSLKKDINYIIYLGTWYLNTPIYYRPNIGI